MAEKVVLETACRLCFPRAIDYGELIDGYFLVEQDNEFFLVDSNGHDKRFVFSGKPRRDPYTGMTDDEINNAPDSLMADFDAWLDDCMKSKSVTTNPDPGAITESNMALAIAMYKNGWRNPDQRTELTWNVTSEEGALFWLYEVAGNLLQRESS